MVKQDSDIKGNIKKASYTFKYKSGIASVEAEGTGIKPINTNIKISQNTYDIVSLLYYLRTLNYPSFAKGKTFPVSVLVLERILNVNIKYLGTEQVKVPGWLKKLLQVRAIYG
jgi:hypothetical protein